jgi:hypothetical protein
VIDLTALEFATPLDLVALACLVGSAREGTQVRIHPPRAPLVANYLLRMDLPNAFAANVQVVPAFAPETPRDETPGLIELTCVRAADDLESINTRLFARLESALSEEALRAVIKIIAELLDNARTHGGSAMGTYLAAQYYTGATSGMPPGFWIAVGDAGVGVRESLALNPAHQDLDDTAAIRVASQPGVSGLTDTARGLGLLDVRTNAGRLAPGQVITLSGRGEGHFFVGPAGATARYRTRPTKITGTWTLALAGRRDS